MEKLLHILRFLFFKVLANGEKVPDEVADGCILDYRSRSTTNPARLLTTLVHKLQDLLHTWNPSILDFITSCLISLPCCLECVRDDTWSSTRRNKLYQWNMAFNLNPHLLIIWGNCIFLGKKIWTCFSYWNFSGKSHHTRLPLTPVWSKLSWGHFKYIFGLFGPFLDGRPFTPDLL